jgi:hypothetical protein
MKAVSRAVSAMLLLGLATGVPRLVGSSTLVAAQKTLNPPLLAEVSAFLNTHKEFGTPLSTQSVPDWAQGKRQRVVFDSGRSLLFYTKEGRVVTVYEDTSGAGRKVVWGETEQNVPQAPATRVAVADLPAYKVLFSAQKIGGGGKFGDVLVSSLSRKTPAKTREDIAKKIASKEGLSQLSLYSTDEAYRANNSESFSKAHPGAMKRGFLGSLQDGKFTAGEVLFP